MASKSAAWVADLEGQISAAQVQGMWDELPSIEQVRGVGVQRCVVSYMDAEQLTMNTWQQTACLGCMPQP